MKKLSNFFLSLVFLLKFTALEAYSSDPKEFVTELVKDAIEKLSSTKLSKEEKALFIEEIALDNKNKIREIEDIYFLKENSKVI